jgi:hypothetical protein
MLFGETGAGYCDNRTEHTSVGRMQNMLKQVVRILTIRL